MVFTYVHICLDHFGYAKSYCGWGTFRIGCYNGCSDIIFSILVS